MATDSTVNTARNQSQYGMYMCGKQGIQALKKLMHFTLKVRAYTSETLSIFFCA